MKVRTIPLPADVDPFEVGRQTGTLWAHDTTLAGVGELARVTLDRHDPIPAQAALAAWADQGHQAGHGPGSGAVGFTAMAFDPGAPAALILPELVLGCGPRGERWLSILDESSPDEALARLRAISECANPEPSDAPGRIEVESVLHPSVWCGEVLVPVRDLIRSGELHKTVLARELSVTAEADFSVSTVLGRLRQRYATSILFAVDGFVGASPELLVSRSGDRVTAHPLAGTSPRSDDPTEDARLAAALLASPKNRAEHLITIEWLLDTLLPFCSYVDAGGAPTVLSLANVHHLGTPVWGKLSTPSASVLELVAALHPTPAVGGEPQALALTLIDRYERADRGRYAGPVGWVDTRGNGAFAVGIRSAEISGQRARVFAGVGVVADSEPDSELAETESKFAAMLGALLGE